MNNAVRWRDNSLFLNIQVQPRASRDEVKGLQGDAIRIRITAPPVEGKANDHLLRFLADQFGVPRRRVVLVSGAGHRCKRVQVENPAILPAWLPANDKADN
jgi:uncharacterized protein (TIGR00251 family)